MSRPTTTEDLLAEVESARAVAPPANPDDAIAALVREGEKIEAIKLHRETYCTSLADAKAAIDAISRGETPATPPVAPEPASDAEVVALVEQGRLIDAIKAYRELYDVGLKEAKDAVDRMRA
jgi:ribosomal protein L7/L12